MHLKPFPKNLDKFTTQYYENDDDTRYWFFFAS